MSVFYCLECDNYIDSDDVECAEHPKTKELTCIDCYEKVVNDYAVSSSSAGPS